MHLRNISRLLNVAVLVNVAVASQVASKNKWALRERLLQDSEIQQGFETEGSRPLWILESSFVGLARESCGAALRATELPVCSDATFESFKSYSQVLQNNWENFLSLAGTIVCHGNNDSIPLLDCQVSPQQTESLIDAFRHAPQYAPEDEGPDGEEPVHFVDLMRAQTKFKRRQSPEAFRLIVDSQYVNTPRCCAPEDYDGLALGPGGVPKEWTQDAMARLANKTSDNGVQYFEARPKWGTCTEETQCPLVIQFPGAGGMAWLLVQASCQGCYDQLRTVLVSPMLAEDLVNEDGMNFGSSTQELISRFIPWVDIYLNNHRDVDRSKVYLVAQSRGDDAALRAAILRPDLFAFVSLSGKNSITNETKLLLDFSRQTSQKSRLQVIHFNVGDYDTCFRDRAASDHVPALAGSSVMGSPDFEPTLSQTIAHVGQSDEYYANLKDVLSGFSEESRPRVDVRIFLESRHSVWYAAWNVIHEVIWTNQRTVEEISESVPLTCRHGSALT